MKSSLIFSKIEVLLLFDKSELRHKFVEIVLIFNGELIFHSQSYGNKFIFGIIDQKPFVGFIFIVVPKIFLASVVTADYIAVWHKVAAFQHTLLDTLNAHFGGI